MASQVFEYLIVFGALLSGAINVEGRDQVDIGTRVTYTKLRSPTLTTQFQTTLQDLSNLLLDEPLNSYDRPSWNARRPQQQFSGFGQNLLNNFPNPFSGNFLNFFGNPGQAQGNNNNGLFNRGGYNSNPFSTLPTQQFGGRLNPFSFEQRPRQNIQNPMNWFNTNTRTTTNSPIQNMQQTPEMVQATEGTTALPVTTTAIPEEGTSYDDYGAEDDDLDIRSA